MFCSNCGAQIEDGAKYCPNCGSPVDSGEVKGFVYSEPGVGADAGNAMGNQDNGGSFGGQANGGFSGGQANDGFSGGQGNDGFSGGQATGFTYNQPYNIMPLKTDRSLLIFVLLSIVTCGIYWYIFFYELVKDINTACEGDGDETPGLLMFVLLSIVTCGIYSFYWYYKVGNRLALNCGRYGFSVSENGVTVLLWMLLGQFVCCIGPFIAWNIIISHTNMICTGYNRAHGIG